MTAGGITFREAALGLRAAMGNPAQCCTAIDVATFGRRSVDVVCGCAHNPNMECPCVVAPPPPPPPPPSMFEQVVGVTVEDWISANTTDELADLLRRRDERSA